MKYLLAFINFFIGVIQSFVRWLLFLPFTLFTLPIKKWNDTIYGKDEKSAQFYVREIRGNKVQIILPNGDIIYADKLN